MKANFQKPSKGAMWVGEDGVSIPVDRLTKDEKLREKTAEKLLKEALVINKKLSDFKGQIADQCREVMVAVYEHHGQDPEKGKGNFTWYNFDRSVRIEVSVNFRIDFDDTVIKLCQHKLTEFLDEAVTTSDHFIKQFVHGAFEKSRGALDAKKVMSLLKHRNRVSHPLFQEALNLLEESVRYPDSRRYFRISVKDEEGAYQVVDLNFSSI